MRTPASSAVTPVSFFRFINMCTSHFPRRIIDANKNIYPAELNAGGGVGT